MDVLAGSLDVSTYFQLSLLADGADATGLTIADMDLQYVRSGEVPAAKVDAVALAATDTAHTDNRAIEIDATDQPGLYRFDWPDAAFASGAREVFLTVKCALVKTQTLRVNLTPVPADVRQWLGTAPATPNVAGVPKVDLDTVKTQAITCAAGVTILASVGTAATSTAQTGDAYAKVDTEVAALQTSVNDLPTNAELATALGAADDAVLAQLATILTLIDTEIAAVKAQTDLIPAFPAAVGSAMTLTSGERNAAALALLKYDFAGITGEAARSMLNAQRKLMNKWSIAGSTLTIFKEDDSTPAWTQAIVTSASAEPITGLDTV